jgi:hypothetical protein
MADNFAATPGSGATFGMDEVIDGTLGTVKVGFGKIMDGTLDSTNKLIVNSSGEALVKNTTGNTSLASIDGKITAVNTGAVVVSSSALPTLAATSTKQSDGTQQTKLTNGTIVVDVKTLGTQVTSTDNGLIVNAAIHGVTTGGGGGYVDVKVTPSGAVSVDGTTVVTGTVTTKETRSATPTQTSVSVTTASTSILASNANRLGATITNEGTAICYTKLGATASVTSYSIQIASGGYYEVPFQYTGAIDGITSASTAQLRITEIV